MKQRYWEISVDTWIIIDGMYNDFRVKQDASFAVEMFVKNCKISHETKKYAEALGICHYKVIGKILYIRGKHIILDFGIVVFGSHSLFETARVGDYIEAEVYLNIHEGITTLTEDELPLLTRNWSLEEILQITGPYISYLDKYGRKAKTADFSKANSQSIDQTNAWEDEGYDSERYDDERYLLYQLNCSPKDILSGD